jgi:hypothetical protein
MNHDARTRYSTRRNILGLLSDAEVAGVSTAETAARLEDGDEYLDLEHLDDGVRRASQDTTPMRRILPRKAVEEATWGRILRELAGPSVAMPHSGGLWDDVF